MSRSPFRPTPRVARVIGLLMMALTLAGAVGGIGIPAASSHCASHAAPMHHAAPAAPAASAVAAAPAPNHPCPHCPAAECAALLPCASATANASALAHAPALPPSPVLIMRELPDARLFATRSYRPPVPPPLPVS